MADEVISIIKAGCYVSPAGESVSLRESLVGARAGTATYPPGQDAPDSDRREGPTRIAVANETTLRAARRLAEQDRRVAALNFANAMVPGGGFLVGALAQEESLCRASGLFACLLGNPMYRFHQARSDFLYTDYVIYSPDVPVFRDEEGALLEEPWSCSFLTSPAPFATLHLAGNPDGAAEIEPAFRTRIEKVLGVAAGHGHDVLVLGAWGCGAFENDPTLVARLFRETLDGPFRDVFAEVVFAITDSTPAAAVRGAFESAFPSAEA